MAEGFEGGAPRFFETFTGHGPAHYVRKAIDDRVGRYVAYAGISILR